MYDKDWYVDIVDIADIVDITCGGGWRGPVGGGGGQLAGPRARAADVHVVVLAGDCLQ